LQFQCAVIDRLIMPSAIDSGLVLLHFAAAMRAMIVSGDQNIKWKNLRLD